MNVPASLLVHRITVEAYLGNSAYGPQYADPVTQVPAFVDQQSKQVRNRVGVVVMSSTTVICRLSVVAPAQSQITLPDGTVTRVINALRRDSAGLGAPNHLELQLE